MSCIDDEIGQPPVASIKLGLAKVVGRTAARGAQFEVSLQLARVATFSHRRDQAQE